MKWWPGKRRALPVDIVTSRLVLRVITPAMMAAEANADGSLPALLNARVTNEWPPVHWEPHVFASIQSQWTTRPDTAGWHRYVVLREGGTGTLVGCTGAFPKDADTAEIGYSTLPGFQRRGIATEAVGALVDWLLQQSNVARITAQTFPALAESIKVMERSGLRFTGEGDDAGTVRYERLR